MPGSGSLRCVVRRWGVLAFAFAFGVSMPGASRGENFRTAIRNGNEDHEPARRNFVFFLADDLGWTDVGCFGSSFYETPNIDRLAARGMRFTRAYAACPVCSPTRASLLTGKYPARVGVTDYISPDGGNQPERWGRGTPLLPSAYRDRLALEETTLAEALRAAGYATFFAGKWHIGPAGFYPEDQGFEHNQGGIERGGPYGGKQYFSPYGNPRLDDGDRALHRGRDREAASVPRVPVVLLGAHAAHRPAGSRREVREEARRSRARRTALAARRRAA